MAAPITTKLVLNTAAFSRGIGIASRGLGKLAGAAAGVLGFVTKLGLAFTAFGGVLTALILRQAQFIDRLGKVSDVIGVNIQTLQKFRFAAEQGGVSIEQADVALRRFSRRLGEAKRGTGELLPTLRQLGLTQQQITELSPEQALLFLSDAIKETTDDTDALRIAFKAFDSEGAELVKTLRDGSDGLGALFTEAEALGFILDRETVQGVEDFNDELNKLTTLIGGLVNRFVAELAPALREVTEEFIEFVKSFKDEEGSFESLGKFLKDQFIDGLVVVVQVLEKLLNVLIAVTNAILNLGRTLGVSGIPELSDDAKKARQELEGFNEALTALEGGGFIGRGPSDAVGALQRGLQALEKAGIQGIEDFQKRFEELGFFDKLFGDERVEPLLNDVKTFVESAITELEKQTGDFDQVDFTSLIDLLLGNKEENKEKIEQITDGIEEVVTTATQRFSGVVKFLDNIFGKDLVNAFLDGIDRMEEAGLDLLVTIAEGVLASLDAFLNGLADKMRAAGVGDFMKTLQDGFVKAATMLEDALADAIVKGKADFSDLGEHIKQVIAKALVQKFITNPIFAAFGLLADGGPAQAGRPYIVGEEGPELFVPNTSGTVIPNDQITRSGGMAMGSTQVVYNINAVDAPSFQQLVASDPQFIYAVTQAGARTIPGSR